MKILARAAAFSISIAACGGGAQVAATSAPTSPSAPPVAAAPIDPQQRFAELGTCALESGERILDCRIGYRTFGTLDATGSNAVLFPTWFTGTTKDLLPLVPGKLVDTSRYYLILVDALGDGVSTSPSNSAKQPRLRFPKFTIGDMVESQKRLLDSLGIRKLHAVMGISMGGMQALAWGMRYPETATRVVSIVGTPQLTSQDLLLWNAELHALESDVAYRNGEYEGRPVLRAVNDIHWLMLGTPAQRSNELSRAAFPAWLEEREKSVSFDWNDWHRQLEAMLAHDLARPFGGSVEEAARTMKARALVVVAEHDHMVSPIPARRFADAAHAQLLVLDGPCGHLAPNCEAQKLATAVAAWMDTTSVHP